ncbi:MAG: YciN family protein [Shewanella sp.]|uniref:YciN family protein n=1 Tax=Vibrio chanodichtyis TaxID=3027932 RepID=A0ABT5UWA7_9VIBR|nr:MULTISPECIES: YciN family protein [Vibrio]MDE1513702.1 YciN family protein [Vibrio chanodichtyis]
MSNKQPITEFDLLLIANHIIQNHEHYLDGMRATQVEEKEGVLVFKGEYFLTDQGLPSVKTTAVFNMFKYLAHQLSPQFTLQKLTQQK